MKRIALVLTSIALALLICVPPLMAHRPRSTMALSRYEMLHTRGGETPPCGCESADLDYVGKVCFNSNHPDEPYGACDGRSCYGTDCPYTGNVYYPIDVYAAGDPIYNSCDVVYDAGGDCCSFTACNLDEDEGFCYNDGCSEDYEGGLPYFGCSYCSTGPEIPCNDWVSSDGTMFDPSCINGP